ncbi:MAG: glycosyltransferase family 2 protein [Steroidobacteraceae bacterium]
MTVSVLILTLDEEVNIEGCLAAVRWSDDVVVLDSGSTDGTASLVARAGARLVLREFDNYAGQRNFGLRHIPWRHPWVLMLDADERVPDDLAREITAGVSGAHEEVCLMRMRRKDFLFGTWIRGSGGYPTWFPRLARHERVWVERPINEEYKTNGQVIALQGHLYHYPFNKGIAAWIAKHNRYSTLEAELHFAGGAAAGRTRLAELFAGDPLARRRALKSVVYRMPFRPFIVFLAGYVLKGGFLEGRAGLTFSLLRSWYEHLINLKIAELRRRSRNLPV